MTATVRSFLVALLMVLVGAAGCVGKDAPPEDAIPDPDSIGALETPRIEKPALPPCTLRGGDIDWPDVQGAPVAHGNEVTIRTDAYGVSHIYADDAYSLWYANGYVQARDRLFQMDILRMVGHGHSAKHLGEGQLGSDFLVHRTLYTTAELEAQYAAAPDEAKEVIEAYTDGVNRFIGEAIARDQLPSEFGAVSRVPPPWTAIDSVAVIDYLIGYFGVDGGAELSNLRRLAQLHDTLDNETAWDAFEDLV